MPQGVRPDRLGDPGAAGDPADDPPSAVPVQPSAIGGQEDPSVAALVDGQVDRPGGARRERDRNHLATLAGDHQGPVPPLDTQRFDAGAGGLRHPQPVEGQQRDQRVLTGRAEPGGDQHRAKLTTVQPGGVRFIIQPGPADVSRRGMIQQLFLDGVTVKPGHGA